MDKNDNNEKSPGDLRAQIYQQKIKSPQCFVPASLKRFHYSRAVLRKFHQIAFTLGGRWNPSIDEGKYLSVIRCHAEMQEKVSWMFGCKGYCSAPLVNNWWYEVNRH